MDLAWVAKLGKVKEVKGNFECINCSNLVDIKDLPKKIGGYINFKGSINIPNYDQYQIQRYY